jgi:chemotaxis signal transduction protein
MDMNANTERSSRILAERAAVLAREVAREHAPEDRLDVALCTVGSEVFALPIDQLREIVPLPIVTPVPGCPDWMLGVAHVRGSLLSVVSLAGFCHAKGESKAEHLAVVTGPQGLLGLTVDKVLSVRTISLASLGRDDHQERRASLGVTPNLEIVLDVPLLFTLPELVIE